MAEDIEGTKDQKIRFINYLCEEGHELYFDIISHKYYCSGNDCDSYPQDSCCPYCDFPYEDIREWNICYSGGRICCPIECDDCLLKSLDSYGLVWIEADGAGQYMGDIAEKDFKEAFKRGLIDKKKLKEGINIANYYRKEMYFN